MTFKPPARSIASFKVDALSTVNLPVAERLIKLPNVSNSAPMWKSVSFVYY